MREETKKKISAKLKGLTRSQETRERMSQAKKGMVFTEEHKQKISSSNKGKVRSEETKRKISNAKRGYKHSEETKKKISEGNKRSYAQYVEKYGKRKGHIPNVYHTTPIGVFKNGMLVAIYPSLKALRDDKEKYKWNTYCYGCGKPNKLGYSFEKILDKC